MRVEEIVFLKASNKSTQRTRNRIREHGAQGFIVSSDESCPSCLKGKRARLFDSVSITASGGVPWSGWLALEEIEVINENR
tara:strand:- start:265 stop:507 length:243 start_codon:yes stop_codon:yes gene_type:complete